MAYSLKVAEIFPELDEYGYHKLQIIFAGDLNINLKSNEGNEFIIYMQDRFGVQLNNDPSISIYIFMLWRCFTQGKTCFIFYCLVV
jgi:nitrogenase molybdenum-iron protein alpha/beta subunit